MKKTADSNECKELSAEYVDLKLLVLQPMCFGFFLITLFCHSFSFKKAQVPALNICNLLGTQPLKSQIFASEAGGDQNTAYTVRMIL